MRRPGTVAARLSVLLALAARPAAGAQNLSPEDAAYLERVNRPVVLRVPGMDRVRVRKNLIYQKDAAVELAMDVYTPEKTEPPGRVPAVFFIHGGVGPEFPVRPKDWGFYQS